MKYKMVVLILVSLIIGAGCKDYEVPANEPLLRPSETVTIQTSFENLREYQELADKGEEPYRLDPLETAMREMNYYFFDPSAAARRRFYNIRPVITRESIIDKKLWQIIETGKNDEKIVRWQKRDIRFDVYLKQFPAKEGKQGIWYAIKYLHLF